MFKKISSKTVYKNNWMKVFEDEIEFSNGDRGIYGYITRSDGVCIAVVNSKNEILLIKQYRYPVKRMEWNVPGGAIDGGDPMEAVIREVKEEVGIEVGSVEKLIELYPLSCASTEKVYVYFVKVGSMDLIKQDVSEHDEYIEEKRFVPIKDALDMIDNGEIDELITCNTIQTVARKLKVY